MKLSKISIPYRAVKSVGTILAIGVFSTLETASLSPGYALAMLAMFSLGSLLVALWFYLVWKNFSFEITEDTFDIKSGVIRKQRREIPLHRIQNVDVSRSIFQRILGIAKINLETAGGKTSEASLKYVDLEKAQDIQRRIRELKQEEKVSEDKNEESPIFSLSQKELAVLSLTSLNWKALSTVFVAMGVLGTLSPAIDEAVNLTFLMVAAILGGFLVLGGLITSAASNLNKYYDFKLYRRGDSLEYERGLLNRSEGSIPFEKIQNLRIEENPLQRFFGYATLKVETAGYSGQDQQQQGPEVAVPLAEKNRVEQLSNKIFQHGSYDIQSIPVRGFRRYFGRYLIVSIVIHGIYFGITRLTGIGFNALTFIPLIGISAVAAYLKYIHRGFYEGEEFFYTRNGFWNQITSITPYYRIQNLELSRTIFQRNLGLSSLVLDTAGIYAFARNPRAVDIDEEVTENLFERVFASFRSSTKRN